MLRTEIIRTCSHEAVAAAALMSLGSEFHSRIALLAAVQDMSTGSFAAHLVIQFEADADEDAWYALGNAITKQDMPVLAGFRFILETMTGEEITASETPDKRRSKIRHAPPYEALRFVA